jgi:hypothetical protein
MKPCISRAGLKLGPPCVISLEYTVPGRGARKKASNASAQHSRASPTHLQHFLSYSALQNVTLKQLGQDGDGADAVTRKIVKAVQQVRRPRSSCPVHSHLDPLQSLIINAAAELGIGKVGVMYGCRCAACLTWSRASWWPRPWRTCRAQARGGQPALVAADGMQRLM